MRLLDTAGPLKRRVGVPEPQQRQKRLHDRPLLAMAQRAEAALA